MIYSIRSGFQRLTGRARTRFGERATAFLLALVVEGLIVLALIAFAPSPFEAREAPDKKVLTFDVAIPPDPAPEPEQAEPEQAEPEPVPEEAKPEPEQQPEPVPEPPQPPKQPVPKPIVTPPAPRKPAFIEMKPDQMAAVDLRAIRPAAPAPPAPARPATPMGPPNTGQPADTPLVDGTGPNGEPLYAASWYREPYPEELRGYLSTARSQGWGMIACRTVADYRVADCVPVAEYPNGSDINRAILAAAWQFRVRPPRVGGKVLVGQWVRIRISYEQRPAGAAGRP
ncbi:protein TonB [Sphingobium sp. B7D2B]|uniref:hypothetical protein n=1 Tax=Sphingobium sp. B7D2B TaxID=2940583 RepID=UPI002224537E|nr:hypothetical protein [Sphingobium sp. B7D2B]MCW2365668.1 protein TonB [Sphingobium sp. B7D2B]